jgi:hypothetical protein
MQNKDGDNGEYAHWCSDHFKFFHAQEDKISQYEAWKDLDLKLRREYRTEPTKFDINHYATKYEVAKTTFELKALIKEQTLNGVKDFPYQRDNPYHQLFCGGKTASPSATQFRDMHSLSQPALFPSGSQPSHLACCLLCGENGHPVRKHYGDGVTPPKFPDGKPTWAKITNGRLCTPNGKEICINYNVSNANCTHSERTRAHLCSFCGSRSHYTFSWVCRACPPSNQFFPSKYNY